MLIKKQKEQKRCVIKKEIMFNKYVGCLKEKKKIMFIQEKLIK